MIPRLNGCRVFPWLWNYHLAVWHMGSWDSWFGVKPFFAVIPEVCLLSSGNSLRWGGGGGLMWMQKQFNHWGRNFSARIFQTIIFSYKKGSYGFSLGKCLNLFLKKKKFFLSYKWDLSSQEGTAGALEKDVMLFHGGFGYFEIWSCSKSEGKQKCLSFHESKAKPAARKVC